MSDFDHLVYQYQIPVIDLNDQTSRRATSKTRKRESEHEDDKLILVVRHEKPLSELTLETLPEHADKDLFFRRRAALIAPRPFPSHAMRPKKRLKADYEVPKLTSFASRLSVMLHFFGSPNPIANTDILALFETACINFLTSLFARYDSLSSPPSLKTPNSTLIALKLIAEHLALCVAPVPAFRLEQITRFLTHHYNIAKETLNSNEKSKANTEFDSDSDDETDVMNEFDSKENDETTPFFSDVVWKTVFSEFPSLFSESLSVSYNKLLSLSHYRAFLLFRTLSVPKNDFEFETSKTTTFLSKGGFRAFSQWILSNCAHQITNRKVLMLISHIMYEWLLCLSVKLRQQNNLSIGCGRSPTLLEVSSFLNQVQFTKAYEHELSQSLKEFASKKM